MSNTRHDWRAIEDFFVEGELDDQGNRSWPTQRRVAELFEVSERLVRERIAAEDLSGRRAAFKANHEKILAGKRAADLAKEATELDASALRVAKVGLQLLNLRSGEILKAVADKRKAQQEAVASGEEYEDYGLSPIDPKELAALAAAGESYQRIGARALGEVETTRTELTGVGGAPLQVQSHVSVRAELVRDDRSRMASVLTMLAAAGSLARGVEGAAAGEGLALAGAGDDGEDREVSDGEDVDAGR